MQFFIKIFILFLFGFFWRVLINSFSIDFIIFCTISTKTFCFDYMSLNPRKLLYYFSFILNSFKSYFLSLGVNIDLFFPPSFRMGNVMKMNRDRSFWGSTNTNATNSNSINSNSTEILVRRGLNGNTCRYTMQEWQNFVRIERDWYNNMERRGKFYMVNKANSYVAAHSVLNKNVSISKSLNASNDYDVESIISMGKLHSYRFIESVKASWNLDMTDHPTNINQKVLEDMHRKNIRTFLDTVVSKKG